MCLPGTPRPLYLLPFASGCHSAPGAGRTELGHAGDKGLATWVTYNWVLRQSYSEISVLETSAPPTP